MKAFGYLMIVVALLVIAVVSLAGFRGSHSPRPPMEIFPDMNYQDKVKDQVPSAFFADGVASRMPIDGTVAQEMPAQGDYASTGKWDETHWGNGIPVHDAKDGGRALQVDAMNMARGRERYTINCAICHGAAGDGKGITSKYGLNGAASYHSDRLRQTSDGDLFNTISNGKGQMMGYAYNINIDDRWRIVMYIRALQFSQNAQLNDASPEEQAQLNKSKKPAAGATIKEAPRNHDAFFVPPRLIDDSGMVAIGKTYFIKFASPAKAKPPETKRPMGSTSVTPSQNPFRSSKVASAVPSDGPHLSSFRPPLGTAAATSRHCHPEPVEGSPVFSHSFRVASSGIPRQARDDGFLSVEDFS